MEEEVEKEEEEGEGVDPTLLGDLHHTVSINFENAHNPMVVCSFRLEHHFHNGLNCPFFM